LDNEKNNRKKATNEHIDQAACAYEIDDTNITKRTKRNLIKMAESPTSTLETTTQKDVHSPPLSVIEESIEATNAPNIEKDQKTNKTTFILGDSIVKDLDGYLLTGSLQKKFIVKVRSFSSATTECMWDYCKPTLRKDDPSNIILHTGTCDFKLEKEPEEIAEDIVKLAKIDNKDNKEEG